MPSPAATLRIDRFIYLRRAAAPRTVVEHAGPVGGQIGEGHYQAVHRIAEVGHGDAGRTTNRNLVGPATGHFADRVGNRLGHAVGAGCNGRMAWADLRTLITVTEVPRMAGEGAARIRRSIGEAHRLTVLRREKACR